MNSIAKSITARNKRIEERKQQQATEVFRHLDEALKTFSYQYSGQRRVDETVELFQEVEHGKRSWASAYRAATKGVQK